MPAPNDEPGPNTVASVLMAARLNTGDVRTELMRQFILMMLSRTADPVPRSYDILMRAREFTDACLEKSRV